jgi:hypothetical protein
MGSHSNGHLLADEKHIDSAKIKVVEEWESSKAVISRVLAGIELDMGHSGQTELHWGVEQWQRTMTVFPLY